MKSMMIILLAVVAMAASQGVHVVDNNPSHVHVVDNNPSHVHVVDNNPSQVHVVDNNPSHVHVVDNNPSHLHVVDQPQDQGVNPDNFVVDQAFYRPHNPSNGNQQINADPAFVDQGSFQNRPGKQYDNPYLRGGK